MTETTHEQANDAVTEIRAHLVTAFTEISKAMGYQLNGRRAMPPDDVAELLEAARIVAHVAGTMDVRYHGEKYADKILARVTSSTV